MAPLTDRKRSFDRLALTLARALAALGLPASTFKMDGRTRWIAGFAAASSTLVGAVLLVLWALTGFADLGLHGHGLVALILGILFSTGLGSALMALSFYGDRGGQSEDAQQSGADEGRGGVPKEGSQALEEEQRVLPTKE